jgi:hypothetical protein
MASSPRHQNAPLVAQRRKFPSVLLAVTKNDERRLALLALTKERFVVTDCGVGHDVAQLWAHPKKFDAMLVMFDETLDPTCPLVVQDIRRRELQDGKQNASEVQNLQRSRLGDGDPTPIAAHRAQRFAERQYNKQRLIEAQRMIGVVSLSNTAGCAPPAPHQRTLIIGFCDATNIAAKSAMDHSGQYDAVRLGNPSDAANIEFVVDLLRADYTLPLPQHVPTFEEVVASLSRFRGATKHDGAGSYGWDKLNSSVAATNARVTVSSSSPPASPLGRSAAAAINAVAPLSDQWQSILNAGVSSPKVAGAQKLSLERHLREAKERIAELTTARDAAEHDLATAHATNQQLRTSLDIMQEQLAESQDVRESLHARFESLGAELEDVKREAAIQLRQGGGGTLALGLSRQLSSPSLSEDVQHLVIQNNRLRQTAFEFETALHEKSLECKALQRRLKKMINGGGPIRPAVAGRTQRHPSLCRVQLPDATDLFKSEMGEEPLKILDVSTVKLGAELSTDEDDDETQTSSSDSAENVGESKQLAPQRSVRFSKGSSMIRSKSNGALRRRSNVDAAESHLARESMERSLMAFHDCESHQDALFAGLKGWIQHPGNQVQLSSESIVRPQTGDCVQDNSNAAVISSTWASIEQQFQQSAHARKAIAGDLKASVLLFGDAVPSQGVADPLVIVRALVTENGGDEIVASDLVACVDVICSDFCQFSEKLSGIYHSVLHNFLTSQLQFYDHMVSRLRTMVPADTLPQCLSLLNAIVLHQCSNLKRALAKHTAAEISVMPLARRVLSRTVGQLGAVVAPLRLQLAHMTAVDSLDATTQTFVAGDNKPRPPRRKLV